MPYPKLKNYSTTVPAARSIAEIQGLLVEFGAEKIMLENENRRTTGIQFLLNVQGRPIPFKLPIETKKAATALYGAYKKETSRGKKTLADFEAEAYNICWRILKDWLHSQLSILMIEAVQIEQVFLPYVFDGQKTLAQRFSEGSLQKLLPKYEGE